jgi:AcrR family transcriptional regulator
VRQQATVERLLDAGAEELRSVGLEGLTIRTVALRAGVSAATAYTYFTSKDHLFAQLFWRHLAQHPASGAARHGTGDADPVVRLTALVRELGAMLADSPEMAGAATRALLGTDPAVERLRLRIGQEYLSRFRTALGPDVDPKVLDTLTLTYMGALLQAGMGLLTYTETADRLVGAIEVVMRGPR